MASISTQASSPAISLDCLRGDVAATILYVEDHAPNFLLVEQALLRNPEVCITPSTDGRRGLAWAAELRPELILLDLDLPDMSGEEVLERLRADWRTRDIPVVVISADATEQRIERLLAAGARDYLTKPLDIRRFLEVVDDALHDAGILDRGLADLLAASGSYNHQQGEPGTTSAHRSRTG